MTPTAASILIVDDERMNLDMLSRRLQRSGFVVALAESGRQAIEMVREGNFDLILLDQMMPEMSGTEVLRTLREQSTPEALPIIMVTAVAESDKIAEALEAGANDYITKPVDFKIALARIRSQISRKQVEEALRKSEERYALAAKATRDGVWDWNLVTDHVYYSPRWKQMLGSEETSVEETPDTWFMQILAVDREAVKAAVQRHITGESDVLQCSYRMVHADQSVRWMSCRGIVTRDEHGRAMRLAGSQSDVTTEKTQDALTGMPNRLLLLSDLQCVMAKPRIGTTQHSTHAVLFLDIDKFKEINDSLGHLAGDHLLREVCARLQRVVQEYDRTRAVPLRPLAARMGGDEFAILLKEGATAEATRSFAEAIELSMRPAFHLDSHEVHCTFSIGLALGSPHHQEPEDILRDADFAMYTAKRIGRGEMALFETSMRDAALLQLHLKNDIRLAVQRNELHVVYQPKVDLDSGLTYGMEALLRWNHPTRGQIQPGIFIPIAEETGAIVEMGKWIRHQACRQVRAWHDLFPMPHALELSINLSPCEFKQKNLANEIQLTLEATGFPASALHLEITEGVLCEDMPAARITLNALKELGVRLDLDDFGSGYSSLRYLRELPFDLVKIDRYFTKSLAREQRSSGELISTILTMAENLGMDVVAEGIETLEQNDQLKELGCRLGQGFLFSRPIAADTMHGFLTSEQDGTRQPAIPLASLVPLAALPLQESLS